MDTKSKIKEQIAFGIPPKDVAAYHGMSLKELIKNYQDIVYTAAVDLDVEVARKFYQIAMGMDTDGNMQACVNWLKSRCQWDKLMDRRELPSEEKSIQKVVIETLSAETNTEDLQDGSDIE